MESFPEFCTGHDSSTKLTRVWSVWEDMRESISRPQNVITAFKNKFTEMIVQEGAVPSGQKVFNYNLTSSQGDHWDRVHSDQMVLAMIRRGRLVR